MQKDKTNWLKTLTNFITFLLAVYKLYQLARENGWIEKAKVYLSKLEVTKEVKNKLADLEDKIQEQVETTKSEVIAEVVKTKKQLLKSKPVKLVKSIQVNTSKGSPRTNALLGYIKAEKHTTMSNIRGKFPSVTARTLRRDLEKLEEQGYIAQSGKTRNSSYHVI
jgi:hypothetical protein